MMAQFEAFGSRALAPAAWTVLALAGLLAAPASAQNLPVTPGQRATAQQVASTGVPLADLAPEAPDTYTVKRGDTLWSISGLFLRQPWRWPELWGMNMTEVRNPHRIFPGQVLVLEKVDGVARLRVRGAGGDSAAPLETVRVSPRVRIEPLADRGIPTLQPHLIEPFLDEPVILGEGELERAPRIVAVPEDRVLITRGDRAYVRGRTGTPLLPSGTRAGDMFRVFRSAVPLRDPVTNAVLGYEAQYLGGAELVRGESRTMVRTSSGKSEQAPVPATIDITRAKEEIRVGDRLLPEPPRQMTSYVPRAPERAVSGSIVSVYGNAVAMAGQNQVVVINRGLADGLETGHVLAILRRGPQIDDRSQAGERAQIKLPDERNGLMMVFRPFDRMAYALILEITDTVRVGDTVTNPR